MIEQKDNIQPSMIRASKSTRVISAFIDYLPIMIFSVVIQAIGMEMFKHQFDMEAYIVNSANMSQEDILNEMTEMFRALHVIILPSVIGAGITYLYFFCKDFIGGRSIGKRVKKLQLVRLDGGQVSYLRMFVRNLFIVIWPIEVILYLANSGQRLGDIICKTTVVEAAEDNIQVVDTQKLIIAIALVCLFCTCISFLYYEGLVFFFDWLTVFMHNIILNA